jgi:hypothetical protein
MKEHPILFSTPMVRAILDGKKTMTHRVVKGPPCTDTNGCININGFWIIPERDKDHAFDSITPYYIGRHLWVRETWAENKNTAGDKVDPLEREYLYKADPVSYSPPVKWKSPIFMPRKAARIILEITGIRIERIQDITEADTIKEGINRGPDENRMCDFKDCKYTLDHNENCGVCLFRQLWEILNKKRSYNWESNPWVYAISFKVINP